MNVRVGLAGAVLGILGALSGYAFFRVRTTCRELLRYEDAAARAVSAQSPDTGEQIAALTDAWDRNGQSLQYWVAGEILSTLNQNMKRLIPLYEIGSEELPAELEAVKADIQWIYEQEIMIF